MSKILILGGAGFVGSNLAFYLKEKEFDVTVVDNLVRRGSENNLKLFKQKNIKFIHGDIRNVEDFNNFPVSDIVLLTAAQPSAINYTNPVFDITNNTLGVLNVLEWVRNNNSKLIFWSTNKTYSGNICNQIPMEINDSRYIWSDSNFKLLGWDKNKGFNEDLSVDGKDHSIYGLSKINADLMIQEWSDAFNIESIINRFSCLSGPNQWGKAEQGWVAWFALAKKLGLPVTVYGYGGNQVRDCLFTPDINILIHKQINHLLSSSDNKCYGEVFNVGGGIDNTISVNEVIKKLEINNVILDNNCRRADQAIYISDITKVKDFFEWNPGITFDVGLQSINTWIDNNIEVLEKLYI